MLTISDLVLKREGRILHPRLSLALSAGQGVWVKGPNGSGKSSFIKALLGWLPHPCITWQPNVQKAYLGHQNGLAPYLSVWEYCASHPSLGDFDPKACLSLLEALGLKGYQHQRIDSLSAGQKQRLSLVPVILSGAQVWLLDEPFTALDVASIAQVKTLFNAFLEKGVAMIVVSHHDLSDWATHTLSMEGVCVT
jgi:heme exporter protein A